MRLYNPSDMYSMAGTQPDTNFFYTKKPASQE